MQLKPPAAASEIIINKQLSIADAVKLIEGRAALLLHPDALARCAKAHERLQKVIAEDRLVYGLTTGFGPLANRLIGAEHGAELQQNLIYHLATGVGPSFGWAEGRSLVLARMMSIVQGASGASLLAITALQSLMNSPLSPVVPSKGTVGASGDLTPLAHMVLCFQGVGRFQHKNGASLDAGEGLRVLGVEPLDLARRDGLALVNGTSAMTGVALLNADRANRAISWSLALTAGLAEVLGGTAEAWDDAFSKLRPHPRQGDAAAELRKRTVESAWVSHDYYATRRLVDVDKWVQDEAGQDAYTLRCAPQVIGAVWDTLDWHDAVVTTELNAVTDNPIFPEDSLNALALHGGNFMGQHVGLVSDALGNAICVLAGLAERQVARLTDERLNRGLPAFLHQGQAGLHSGLMGAQVTATALLAEMRSTGPASVQSISTNGANQDVVSMGTIAARGVKAKLDALFQIQAIMALAVSQAVDIRAQQAPKKQFSPTVLMLRDWVRGQSAELTCDRPLGRDIEELARSLARHAPPE